MAAPVSLHPLHEFLGGHIPDRPLVRLAQGPQLQHHPGPAGAAPLRSRVEQRHLLRVHPGRIPPLQRPRRRIRHPPSQLARRRRVPRPGARRRLPLQRLAEGGLHLVLRGRRHQEACPVDLLHRENCACDDLRGGSDAGGREMAGPRLLFPEGRGQAAAGESDRPRRGFSEDSHG